MEERRKSNVPLDNVNVIPKNAETESTTPNHKKLGGILVENNVEIKKGSMFEGVTPYHWIVVLIASCGWLFDCMDQRLFVMARQAALTELLGAEAAAGAVKEMVGYATTSMILGWATGGIIFGMMSDKIGRVKTMVLTLLVYSGFTGLCAFSQPQWNGYDFILYRFLVGLGVGGMFGAATSLVAESVPAGFRAMALGTLQALSATGNMMGAFIAYNIIPSQAITILGREMAGWQVLFMIGILPSILVIPIVLILREPEAWKKVKEESKTNAEKSMGSISDLFTDKRWRRNTLVGLCLGVSGMVGLWGIGFYTPELISDALSDNPLEESFILQPTEFAQVFNDSDNKASVYLKGRLPQDLQTQLDGLSGAPSAGMQTSIIAALNEILMGESIYSTDVFPPAEEISKEVESIVKYGVKSESDQIKFNRLLIDYTFGDTMKSLSTYAGETRAEGMLYFDVGAFLGIFAFTYIAAYFSRRLAFLLTFIMCLFVTVFVFWTLDSPTDAYWMLPFLGFAQLAVFGGYSIYFPELYPTRMRGTGVGFCYNTVRYLLAPFPAIMMLLTSMFFEMGFSEPIRTAAVIMSSIYILGIVALIWAPETKDQPLPED